MTKIRALSKEAIQAFEKTFGERFKTSEAIRTQHARDESAYDMVLPDGVIYAQNTEDVIQAVKLCQQYEVPLIPYGVGSSLEGHILPIEGGVTLNLSEMAQILSINAEDFTVTVQAGVTREQLNEELRDTGLFFPIDPGANASIGGMCSTRASGTNAVSYGTMRENVLSLKVVTADGKLIKTSSRARKSSSGYDLTRLYIGSEGTLGVIVEATLKIYPVPEATSAAICNFPDMDSAVQCVIHMMQVGVQIGRVEFIDAMGVKAVNNYSKLGLEETPLLVFEFNGSPNAVKEQIELVRELALELGGKDFKWAHKQEERNELWRARHNLYFACLQLRPGSRSITTDVCVPISRLADCVLATAEDLKEVAFPWSILGHVGDGNFHVLMMIDPNSDSERQIAESINQSLVNRAIEMEGTCSGEHGVGIHKMEFLKAEHGEDALAIMRLIKQALDPNNILNPGKIITWDA